MDLQTALDQLPDGWDKLIRKIFALANDHATPVDDVKERMGWLRANIKFTNGRPYIELLKLENESVVTCMHCGRYGKLVQTRLVLCHECEEAGVFRLRGKTRRPTPEA